MALSEAVVRYEACSVCDPPIPAFDKAAAAPQALAQPPQRVMLAAEPLLNGVRSAFVGLSPVLTIVGSINTMLNGVIAARRSLRRTRGQLMAW